MALDNNLITKFKKITRFDLQTYLLIFDYFVTNQFQSILNYYQGSSNTVPERSISMLDQLNVRALIVEDVINNNRNRFESTDWWDLLEILEDIKGKLHTMKNTPKWSRTSVVNTLRAQNPTTEVVLRQNQTIESLLGDSLGYSDRHQDWYDVAIKNDMIEEDYTTGGGAKLKVAASGEVSFSIQSVVDIIDSETMKGKELDKKLQWENDDLKVLNGDDTFLQDMEILSNLRKGDNPEFVSHGLSPEVAVGQNINGISYPILMRQLNETFNRDDSIESFEVTNIERAQDGIFMEMEITSKSYETFNISKTF